MDGISRRDAVRAATVGVAAVSATALASTHATAQPGTKTLTGEEKLKKATTMTTQLLAQAKSPEEAYKTFVSLVSPALADLLAEKLAQTLGAAIQAGTAPQGAQGWEKLVKGFDMVLNWGAPFDPDRMAAVGRNKSVTDYFKDILVTTLHHAAVAAITAPAKDGGANPALLGGSISIGGTWSF